MYNLRRIKNTPPRRFSVNNNNLATCLINGAMIHVSRLPTCCFNENRGGVPAMPHKSPRIPDSLSSLVILDFHDTRVKPLMHVPIDNSRHYRGIDPYSNGRYLPFENTNTRTALLRGRKRRCSWNNNDKLILQTAALFTMREGPSSTFMDK